WPIPLQPHKLQNVQPPPHFLPPPILRWWQGHPRSVQLLPRQCGCVDPRESPTPDEHTSRQSGASCLRPTRECLSKRRASGTGQCRQPILAKSWIHHPLRLRTPKKKGTSPPPRKNGKRAPDSKCSARNV